MKANNQNKITNRELINLLLSRYQIESETKLSTFLGKKGNYIAQMKSNKEQPPTIKMQEKVNKQKQGRVIKGDMKKRNIEFSKKNMGTTELQLIETAFTSAKFKTIVKEFNEITDEGDNLIKFKQDNIFDYMSFCAFYVDYVVKWVALNGEENKHKLRGVMQSLTGLNEDKLIIISKDCKGMTNLILHKI